MPDLIKVTLLNGEEIDVDLNRVATVVPKTPETVLITLFDGNTIDAQETAEFRRGLSSRCVSIKEAIRMVAARNKTLH